MTELILHKNVENDGIAAITINGLPIYVKKRDRHWFAYLPHFKTIGYSAKSAKEAILDARKSLDIFFQVHFERGTIEGALEELDWNRKEKDHTLDISV